ncbi:peptidase [Cupriavidus sp. USMAA2-4]|uniref:PepSY-associated TM helix domain-containing protein n=1 Tax=Cupriavidus sp. USMAA2-4 TaxID=876364 RepID=UPI0008A6E238|nr:PepSY domain-containing protein [Cupriavidus sp. USMAA2-4]AOY96058.1 peptidase [Cupriavidus sp. USMAA2-4]
MAPQPSPSRPATPPGPPSAASYRMLWRWHFYAGLFVMPWLIVLAVTGTLYCFQPQIEPLLYPELLRVAPGPARLPAQALLERARAAAPAGATATTYTVNTAPAASAEFVFRLASGKSESLYLDPYTGDYLGSLSVEDRLMKQVRRLHRALMLGKPGELLMELAACWTLVMIATGLAMWWPHWRERGAAALRLGRGSGARGRWKALHRFLGAWLALGALVFVLSGLPWTASWGRQFKALATAADLGAPRKGAPPRSLPPGGMAAAPGEAAAMPGHEGHAERAERAEHEGHGGHGDHQAAAAAPAATMESLPLADVPWAAGLAPVPSGQAPRVPSPPADLDRVVAAIAARGIAGGYQLVLPNSPSGVFTASVYPADPSGERTLHLDQYGGQVLRDTGYRDYGPVAKAISYGTSLHMGRYFGLANQILCAAISLGLMALAVSGLLMWLKRRRAGTLGAPALPRAVPPMRAWAVGLGLLGLVFPLMGATLVAVWGLDRLVIARAGRQHGPAGTLRAD